MPNLFMEFPLQAPAELAWQLWSDFQGLDRYLPVTIQGGTNSNEIGAVRIFEVDGNVIVERLENLDPLERKMTILSLTHFLPIQELITNVILQENGSTSTLRLEQNYQSCALPEDTTEQILTGIAQTMAMRLGGVLMMLEQGIVFEAEEVQALQINEPAPDFCLQDQYGLEHSLKDHCGKWLLLAFYYADETFA